MNRNEPCSRSLRAVLLLAPAVACVPASTAPATPSVDEDAGRLPIVVAPLPASPGDDAAPEPSDDASDASPLATEAGTDALAADATCAAVHSCAPGACSGGACQPWQINAAAIGPFACHAPFATDGTAVVWPAVFSNGAEPRQVRADGSAATPIALAQPSTDAIIDVAMVGSFVFWTSSDGTSTTLWQAPEGGSGSAASVATFAGRPQGLAVDARAAYAYFDTVVGTTVLVHQCDVAGTTATCTVLATFTSAQPGPLVVDDTGVYWTDPGAGVVSQYSFASGGVSPIASGQRNAGAIALDANDVYWTTDAAGGSGFAVNAMSKRADGKVRVITTGSSTATALAIDASNVYVGVSGLIQSAPIAGGAPATLVTLAASPIDFTCTGGALYWAVAGAVGVYGIRVP